MSVCAVECSRIDNSFFNLNPASASDQVHLHQAFHQWFAVAVAVGFQSCQPEQLAVDTLTLVIVFVRTLVTTDVVPGRVVVLYRVVYS